MRARRQACRRQGAQAPDGNQDASPEAGMLRAGGGDRSLTASGWLRGQATDQNQGAWAAGWQACELYTDALH
eukprot:8755062-Alexandrium_andersonii.AAC.1